MTRMFIPVLLSLLMHVILALINFDGIKNKTVKKPKARIITVTMSYKQPQKIESQKKKVKKIKVKVKPKLKSKLNHKPKPKPKPKPEPEPEPQRVYEEVEESVLNNEQAKSDIKGESTSNLYVLKEAMPLYRKNPPPIYPRTARRRGLQGKVVLEVFVYKNGTVRDLRVLTSSGYKILDKAAVKAVKNWLFEPAMKGEHQVSMWVKLPVQFQLN